MTNKKQTLEFFEIQEIADALTGVENPDACQVITENALYNKYGIYLDSFWDLATDLYNMIELSSSPITNTPYLGLAKKEEGLWLAKRDIEQEFTQILTRLIRNGQREIGKGEAYEMILSRKGKYVWKIRMMRPDQWIDESTFSDLASSHEANQQ